MSAVVFISGRAMNDALGAAGRAHRLLYEELGYDFVELNFSQSDSSKLLEETIRHQSIEFVYGVAGMGADTLGKSTDGRDVNLWEALRVPFISLKGDSPAYFFDRHVMS